MKNDFYEKIRARKPFEIGDIIIYFCLAILVFVLFLYFVILPKTNSADGFKVLIEDKEIFSLSYNDESYSISSDYESYIIVDKDSNTVTIYHNQDKTEMNVLSYNVEKGHVYMHDSNCSNSKDCTYEPAITKTGAIYCAPRKLTVLPLTAESTPPIIGGGL